MAHSALQHDHDSTVSPAEQRASELRRLTLVFVCAAIAFVVGSVGANVGQALGWAPMVRSALTVAVAFIVAAALLRIADVLALRLRFSSQAERSLALSNEARRRLEARLP